MHFEVFIQGKIKILEGKKESQNVKRETFKNKTH
jgi:hypothetical protein